MMPRPRSPGWACPRPWAKAACSTASTTPSPLWRRTLRLSRPRRSAAQDSAERTAGRRRRHGRRPRAVGDLAALGGDRQGDDRLGDVRLVALGVALADLHDVGDHPAVLAVGELIDQRPAGLGIMAPAVGARIPAGGG